MKKTKTAVKSFEKTDKRIYTKHFFLTLLLGIIVAITFSGSINNDFLNWDDHQYVTENTDITKISLTNLYTIFSSFHSSSNYHPLTLISLMLDYFFYGLNPKGYHITNLLIHIINAILLYFLFYIFSKNLYITFISTLIFAVHPLRVESVAWISERKDLLYAMFYLLSMILYLYYLQSKRRVFFIFLHLTFLLSLLAKSMAVTLPAVLVLFDFYYRRPIKKNIFNEKILLFILSLIFSVINLIGQKKPVELVSVNIPVYYNFFIASHGLIFYIFKTLIPVKQSNFYPYPEDIHTSLPFVFYISPLIIVIAAVLIYKYRDRLLIFSSFFYLLTILPVIQLIPVGGAIAADRYTYIPLVFLSFYCINIIHNRLFSKFTDKKNLPLVFCLLISLLLMYLTHNRCLVWKNSKTLWTDTLSKYPKNPVAHNNMGEFLISQNQIEEALTHLNMAIEADKTYSIAYNNKATIFLLQNEYSKAYETLCLAIDANPNSYKAYLNRGNANDYMGRTDEAIKDYKKAIELNPDCFQAYYEMGIVYSNLKKNDDAIGSYSKAIQINPDYWEAYCNRGNLHYFEKKYDKAIEDFSKAIMLNAKVKNLFLFRGISYNNVGKFADAVNDFDKVLQEDVANSEALRNRANSYYCLKDFSKAMNDIETMEKYGIVVDKEFKKQVEKEL